MSLKDVKKIIFKAVEDKAFKKLLLTNPEKALKGFDLSDTERSKLSKLNEENLKKYRTNLEKRSSKDSSTTAGAADEWWVESVTD